MCIIRHSQKIQGKTIVGNAVDRMLSGKCYGCATWTSNLLLLSGNLVHVSLTLTHEDVATSPSLPIFRRRLKTYLLPKSYPDILIWHLCWHRQWSLYSDASYLSDFKNHWTELNWTDVFLRLSRRILQLNDHTHRRQFLTLSLPA